jgi:hypothetical protein
MKHYAPSGMKQSIVASMADALTDAQLDELSAYYSEGLGKRVTELEIAAQQPGLEGLVDTEGLEILQRLIDTEDERLLSYQRLVQATGTVEVVTAMAMNIEYAFFSGMMGSAQLPYSLSDEEILEIVNGQSEQIRAETAAAIFTDTAYMYRDMSIEDLDAFAAFLETDASQAFYSNWIKAFRAALLPRARAFGHDLMVLMGVRKS